MSWRVNRLKWNKGATFNFHFYSRMTQGKPEIMFTLAIFRRGLELHIGPRWAVG